MLVTFRLDPGIIGGASGGANGGVSGGVNSVINYLANNPGAKTKKIIAALDIPQRTLERWLKKLKEDNKIEFRGAPKTGGYFLKENKKS